MYNDAGGAQASEGVARGSCRIWFCIWGLDPRRDDLIAALGEATGKVKMISCVESSMYLVLFNLIMKSSVVSL
jgi:hypothetical protein